MGVSPKLMVYFMEKTIYEWMITRGTQYFRDTSISCGFTWPGLAHPRHTSEAWVAVQPPQLWQSQHDLRCGALSVAWQWLVVSWNARQNVLRIRGKWHQGVKMDGMSNLIHIFTWFIPWVFPYFSPFFWCLEDHKSGDRKSPMQVGYRIYKWTN